MNRTNSCKISKAFTDCYALGAHLKKSDEWLFGVYRGNQRIGFLYERGKMNLAQQAKYAEMLLPENYSDLQEFVKKFHEKVGYHKNEEDAYYFV